MLFLFFSLLSALSRRPTIRRSFHDIDGFACRLCSGLSTGARDLLSKTKIESEISAYLLVQCNTLTKLDAKYAPMCTEISTTFCPLLIQLIQSGKSDDDICAKLGYCSSQQNTLQSVRKTFAKMQAESAKILEISNNKRTNKYDDDDDDECDKCEYFFSWTKARGVFTISQLQKLLTIECPHMKQIASICKKINQDNIFQVFDLINSRVDNEKACELSRLC